MKRSHSGRWNSKSRIEAGAFRNFYWGFLLIMVDFRVGGLDILPDVIGYILLANGLGALEERDRWFTRARGYVWPTMILSVFQLYERSAQGIGLPITGGWIMVILGWARTIFSLLTVYALFMGIREMASRAWNTSIADDALSKWNQYVGVKVASLLSFMVIAAIPVIGFPFLLGLFFYNLILAMNIMGLMRRCESELGETPT